jgi:nucleoside-diphosphate-sugar epimerase
MVQTILGAGGVISTHTAKELHHLGKKVRLVSRNPKSVNANDELVHADLLNAQAVADAVKGSEVVYLTVGLPYKLEVWREQWPIVMRNVIAACKLHNSKLVFFDNVYAYGQVDGIMTESIPTKPSSEKGKVRAQILDMLLAEMKNGNITALVARAADFYGPDTPLSFLQAMVFDNLAKGKKPQWMISDKFKHSFTYTPDAGRATALLGNTEDAFGQVWHLPTDHKTLTGNEFLKLAKNAFGVNKNAMIMPKWMLRMVGLFIPTVKESMEMLYQNEHDYIFDSTKFNARFPDFKAVNYAEGIQNIALWYRTRGYDF